MNIKYFIVNYESGYWILWKKQDCKWFYQCSRFNGIYTGWVYWDTENGLLAGDEKYLNEITEEEVFEKLL